MDAKDTSGVSRLVRDIAAEQAITLAAKTSKVKNKVVGIWHTDKCGRSDNARLKMMLDASRRYNEALAAKIAELEEQLHARQTSAEPAAANKSQPEPAAAKAPAKKAPAKKAPAKKAPAKKAPAKKATTSAPKATPETRDTP